MRTARNLATCGLAATLLLAWTSILWGCGTPSLESGRVRPSALPNELEPVIANQAAYAADPDSALAGVEPGTVMDPLTGLDGCWGAYYTYSAEGGSGLLVDSYEVYRFDAASGEVEFQIYQEDESGTLGVLVIYEGHFAVLGESRVSVTWERVIYSDPQTGELLTRALDGEEDVPGGEFRVTLSGDELGLRGEPAEAGDPGVSRVYSRFACP